MPRMIKIYIRCAQDNVLPTSKSLENKPLRYLPAKKLPHFR